MKIRNIALTGLLGAGALAAGCTNNPPPAASTPPPAPVANASTMPPPSTSVVPQQEAAAPPQEAVPAPAPRRPRSSGSHERTLPPANMPAGQTPAPAQRPPDSMQPPPDYGAPPEGPDFVVETAPPPPRVERFVERPGYTWTPGYWRWDVRDGRHTWIPGAYVPQRSGFSWVPAHWEHGPRGWFFRPGYWANRNGGPIGPGPGPVGPGPGGPPPGSTDIRLPPPPPRDESVVQNPGFVWTPGYWRWDGARYDWIGGQYVRSRPGFRWRAAAWEREPNGVWHFRDGFWTPMDPGPPIQPPTPTGPGPGGPPAGSTDVRVPPPAPRVEPVEQRPGFVWTPGYWRWDGARYDWVAGRYVPSRAGFRWTAATWERGPNGIWHFRDGFWTPMDPGPGMPPGGPGPGHGPGPGGPGAGGGEVVRVQPPVPRIEAAPARPGMIWTGGYWRWTGSRYDWVAGDYIPLRPGSNWVRAHWVQGPGGGWRFVEGHWQPRR